MSESDSLAFTFGAGVVVSVSKSELSVCLFGKESAIIITGALVCSSFSFS